jgi:hypothetical protein
MNAATIFDFAKRSGAWTSRFDIWIDFLTFHRVEHMVEVGVFKGEFAERMLRGVQSLLCYHMIDPWIHLEDWDKPANKDNETFQAYYCEMLDRTEFAARKRNILRGRTSEVIDGIKDESLDFAYVDGDHTLRGISIDLIALYPKIKPGGWIAGDDFSRSIWQHPSSFEPTLVFPFAVYFAEAMKITIHALPFNQFLLEKTGNPEFQFVDWVGAYENFSLRSQLLAKS